MFRQVALGVCGAGLALSVSGCSNPVTPSPAPTLTIACPAAPPAQSLDGKPVLVSYPPPVTSGGEGLVTTTCTPQTGTSFPVGRTSVACSARDASQHTATCSFPVVVTEVPRLSATRFLAFGDSITAGVIATSCPFGGPPTGLTRLRDAALLRADLNASPGVSYPDVLSKQLSLRYNAQSFTVVNEGLPGETAVEGAARFSGALAMSSPEVILLLEGVNDINNGGATAVAGVISSLRSMIRAGLGGGATVMVSTLLPQRQGACRAYDWLDGVDDISAANMQIRAAASSEGAVVVDLHPLFVPQLAGWVGLDGLHPNEAGYSVMAQAFFEAIRGRLEQSPASTATLFPR